MFFMFNSITLFGESTLCIATPPALTATKSTKTTAYTLTKGFVSRKTLCAT
jgi:hypothetical protein